MISSDTILQLAKQFVKMEERPCNLRAFTHFVPHFCIRVVFFPLSRIENCLYFYESS